MVNRRFPKLRRSGFTLLEILIVVAIIVVVAGIGGYYLFGSLEKGKMDAARAQMRVIEQAVDEYRLNHNDRPPNSLQDLLIGDPERGGAPYFKDIKYITDPWGALYLYSYENQLNPTIYCKTPGGVVLTNNPSPQY